MTGSASSGHEINQSKATIRVWSGNPNEGFEEILHKYDPEEYEANVIENTDQISSNNQIVLTEDKESVNKYLFQVDSSRGVILHLEASHNDEEVVSIYDKRRGGDEYYFGPSNDEIPLDATIKGEIKMSVQETPDDE
jgi:hypothetical protein